MRPALLLCALLTGAPAELPAQATRAYRALAPAEDRSDTLFRSISQVHELADGRVLVLNGGGTRLSLLDPTLAWVTEILHVDWSESHVRSRGLMPWHGDSLLFIPPGLSGLRVIAPDGTPQRSFTGPRGHLRLCLMEAGNGVSAQTLAGTIVCRLTPDAAWPPEVRDSLLLPPEVPDSAPIVRIDPAGETVDTLAFARTVRTRMVVAEYGPESFAVTPLINPVPVVDECAVLPDGTVIIVRGADYRLDRLDASGSIVSSIRVPYEAVRVSAAEKDQIVDSARAALRFRRGFDAGRVEPTVRDPALPPVHLREVHRLQLVFAPVAWNPDGSARGVPHFFMPAEELPDVLPPVRAGGVRVDGDGYLWIHRWAAGAEGGVYDVVDAAGQRIDQVLLPPARRIVGFGSGGAIYVAHEGPGAAPLERFRWRAPARR